MEFPNFWIRVAMRPDEYEYYEMLLVYVDYIMIVSHLGDEVSKQIGSVPRLAAVVTSTNTLLA